MVRNRLKGMCRLATGGMLAALLAVAAPLGVAAQDKKPIRIGFSMALTGGLAGAGKSALIGMQIWEADVNKAGGLLGRPVELVFYDDQTNPSTVPGIYTKLLDVDKVDLIVSGYGTNLIAPVMPIAIQRGKLLPGLGGLAVNEEYHYDKYFQISPMGPNPRQDWSRGYFELAKAQGYKTLAIIAADAEFAQNAAEGARRNAKEFGMQVLYDQSYPPTTPDYTPVMRAVKAANPEVVFVASYPPDSAGIIRALAEVGLGDRTQMFGGSMVGPQYVSLANALGPKMNGIVNFDLYVAEPTMQFPGIDEFLAKYQPIAKQQGVDPLGHYLAPWGYAQLQLLEAGIKATGALDDAAIARHLHDNEIATVVGPIRFNKDGEWAKSRMLFVQYKGMADGMAMDLFGKPGARQILYPPEYKTGDWMPFGKAR